MKKHNLINNTTISQGNVKITLRKNNGKKLKEVHVHNSGTQELCKYIRNILSGSYSPNDRPGMLIPCEYKNNETYAEQHYLVNMFSSAIAANPIEGSENEGEGTDDDSWATITLSCIIPDTVLTVGKEIGGFRLYSVSTPRKEYAWIDIHTQKITVESDTNIEVEWTLKVSPFNN